MTPIMLLYPFLRTISCVMKREIHPKEPIKMVPRIVRERGASYDMSDDSISATGQMLLLGMNLEVAKWKWFS